jgi:hypothetical protein
MKYECPYLDVVWLRIYLCWIMVHQMWRLLRNTNPSSRRRGGLISKHINCLRRNKNLVVRPDEARNQARLCWPGRAEIYCMLYCAMLCYALLEDWITDPLPGSGCLRGVDLNALLRLSGVISTYRGVLILINLKFISPYQSASFHIRYRKMYRLQEQDV